MINSVDLIRSDLPYLEGKDYSKSTHPTSLPIACHIQFSSVAQFCPTLCDPDTGKDLRAGGEGDNRG